MKNFKLIENTYIKEKNKNNNNNKIKIKIFF